MSESAHDGESPIRVALVNDYDVVVEGVARILERYANRMVIVEVDTNSAVEDRADIVLYDAFAQPESDRFEVSTLVDNPQVGSVVVYTWNLHAELVEQARRQGARGYLSKALPARDLVAGIEAVHRGDVVISAPERRVRAVNGLDWPGRAEGLSDREAEVLALITQGMSNADVAHLTYLSPNTVKSYIRSVYRKIGAASRTQAVLWGVEHGFQPDKRRIEHWRGGP
jgi:DNA-binding NarL/FixJ family response regulator